MQSKLEKLPKATVRLAVTVPNSDVKTEYNHVLEEFAKNIEVPGFRKGMAPKEMVKDRVKQNELYGEVVNHLLERYYPQAVKEHLLTPISNPKVEIKTFDPEKDLEFAATVAVKPEIKVGDYRKALKTKHQDKKASRSKENSDKLAKGEKINDAPVALSPNDVIDTILNLTEMEVSDLLKEDEADRLMSRLVDQAQTVGLSLDQYLKAQNKSAEQLRQDYLNIAEKSVKAEFALHHLVSEEKVVVEDKEIDQMIDAAGDEKVKKDMQNPMQKWYIKSVLEKNKLVSKLIEEAEKE